MNRFKFTVKSVSGVPFSDKKVIYSDETTKHLYLEVRGDKKTLFYRRNLNGKVTIKHLGHLCLYDARLEVSRLDSAPVADSRSPARDITLQEAFSHYNAIKGEKRFMSSALRYVACYKDKPLSVLSPSAVKGIFDKTVKEGKKDTANSMLRVLSMIINLSIRDGLYNGSNPTIGIKKAPVDARRVVVGKDELKEVLRSIDEIRGTYNSDALDAIKLLIYTGQRKMNVLSMMWREVDCRNGIWTIPSLKFKGRRTQEVFLSRHALEILKVRQEMSKSDYVFPVKGGKGKTPHMTEVKKTFENLKRKCGLSNFRLHDLRRSYGSMLLNEGVPIEVVSKVLGHSSISVTEKVYAFVNRQSLERARAVADGVFGD